MARVQVIDESSQQPVDLNAVAPWDGEGFSITPGDYVLVVESATQTMSSTQKPQMELGLSVVQGATTEQHNGQPIKHWVSLTKAAAGRLRNFLDAVGLAPDAEGGFDDSELIGRQFMGEIFEDEYQKGINLDGTPKIKTSIKIRKERPVEGAAPEAAPAPTPTAPTRPAVPVAPAKPKQPLPPGLPRVASSPPPPAGQRIPLPRR